MSAKLYQFPAFANAVKREGFDSARSDLVTALAEWREKQEHARRTAEQLRWYGRRQPDDGPEAA